MKKYFVEKGLYAGETVIIISEQSNYAIVQPIDDHGRNCGDEVSIPKAYLRALY